MSPPVFVSVVSQVDLNIFVAATAGHIEMAIRPIIRQQVRNSFLETYLDEVRVELSVTQVVCAVKEAAPRRHRLYDFIKLRCKLFIAQFIRLWKYYTVTFQQCPERHLFRTFICQDTLKESFFKSLIHILTRRRYHRAI